MKSKAAEDIDTFLRAQPRSKDGYPDPPPDLHQLEADIWRTTVDNMPSFWFTPESWPLLRQYCMTVAQLNYLNDVLQKMRYENSPISVIEKVSKMVRSEYRILSSLSHRLRIAPSARSKKKQAEKEYLLGNTRTPPGQAKPWDFGNGSPDA